MTDDANNYVIKAIEKYSLKNPTRFGIKILFDRTTTATYGIVINYHLMCAMIILVSAINFLVDPKLVPGRAGLLVTLFLVLTNFFCKAQVGITLEFIKKYTLNNCYNRTKLKVLLL